LPVTGFPRQPFERLPDGGIGVRILRDKMSFHHSKIRRPAAAGCSFVKINFNCLAAYPAERLQSFDEFQLIIQILQT